MDDFELPIGKADDDDLDGKRKLRGDPNGPNENDDGIFSHQ